MRMTRLASLSALAAALSSPALATNGMNLEGYGPIATSMGGAGLAYDNGVAALMNNPATLGLRPDDSAQLDLFLGFLGPDVASTPNGFPTAQSGGSAYYMPAFGFAKRKDQLTWAVGVMAQGGMGTEYAASSSVALGSGDDVRSEVGVGRGILGASFNVNERLTIGGSLDFVWATMDLKMAVPLENLGGLVSGADAGWTPVLGGLGGVPAGTAWGRFDFSNGSDFYGEAKGFGWGAKLGLVYQLSDVVSIGATYHSETSLSDMKTNNASLSAGQFAALGVPDLGTFNGSIRVTDFEWPAMYGVGLSITPNDKLQLAFDVKQIKWSDVMSRFNMTFTTTAQGALRVSMPQNWDDQTVFAGGIGYRVTPRLTVRAGVNHADNPIPASTVNPLFPAITETHYMVGAGYRLNDQGKLDFALSYAPDVTVANSVDNTVITHSQLNWQLLYSHAF